MAQREMYRLPILAAAVTTVFSWSCVSAQALDIAGGSALPAGAITMAANAGDPAGPSETIVHENGLEGTFLRPPGNGPFPAALIIAGSGPTDRNGNAPIGLKTDAYRMLADALAGAGIASLRYDKRLIGRSADPALPETGVRFGTYIDDAETLTRWLSRQPEIGPVFLIGHSEGSSIALAVASRVKVAGVVSLEGAGRRFSDVLRSQLAGSPFQEEANKILAELEAGRIVAQISPALYPLFRPSVQPFLMSWLRFDSAEVAQKLKTSLLIVRGSRDLQVSEADFNALARARQDAATLVIGTMNHTLKDVGESLEANRLGYTDPTLPLAHGLAGAIAAFILQHKGDDAADPASPGAPAHN